MLQLFEGEVKRIAEELIASDITLNEAENAVKAAELLKKGGIGIEDWPRLAQAAEKMAAPEFRQACLKMLKLMEETGKDYKSLVSHCEKLEADARAKEERNQRLDQEIATRNGKVKGLDQQILKLEQRAREERARTEEVLKKEGATRAEVEGLFKVRTELKSKGLDIPTFILIASEFAGSKDLTLEVKKGLKEAHSLAEAQVKLKAENDELKVKLNALKPEVDTLSQKKVALTKDEAALAELIAAEEKLLAKLKEQRGIKKRQYGLFEALLATFSTGTPYQDATVQKLASCILELGKGWYPGRPVEELKGIFVTAVCGSYLHSIHCTRCQARFIVDRPFNAYNRYYDKYECPVCHLSWYTEANDDFISAMFSQEELTLSSKLRQEIERLKQENERFRPLEVFLDIPCSVCKKPMGNNWAREQVLSAFSGWRHTNCGR